MSSMEQDNAAPTPRDEPVTGRDMVSTGEAARMLGVSPSAIRKRIQRGTLRSVKLEGQHFIPVRDIQEEAGAERDASHRPAPAVTAGQKEEATALIVLRQKAEIERQAAEIQSLKAMLEATSTQLYERLADSQDQVKHLRKQNEQLIALLRTAVERIGR